MTSLGLANQLTRPITSALRGKVGGVKVDESWNIGYQLMRRALNSISQI